MEISVLIFSLLVTFANGASYNYKAYGADWTAGDCDTGSSQSPINVDEQLARLDENIGTFRYFNYDKSNKLSVIKNNGHTLQVDMADLTVKMSGGGLDSGNYVLAQFHFHWGTSSLTGSEHTINNKQYPLEVHFVHWKESEGNFNAAFGKANGLAVMGYMFELSGSDNPNLNFFINQVKDVKHYNSSNTNGVALSSQPALQQMLSSVDKSKFFRYSGSLTTPTCDEVVQWTVFKDTIPISESQMTKIRATFQEDGTIIGYNYRPIQKQGTRVVKISYKPEVNGSSNLLYNPLIAMFSILFYMSM